MIPKRAKSPLWHTAPQLAQLDRDIETLKKGLDALSGQGRRQEIYVYEDAISVLQEQRQKLLTEMAE